MEETLFDQPYFSEQDRYLLEPFFTNLDKSVYGIIFLPPEVVGALCSRASRSKDDLRLIFLNEFIKPFADTEHGKSFRALVDFLHYHSFEKIFANPKAREFYLKWLAEYGDDSIAQMSGTHLVFSSLSQLAIKHFENQRIGLAPIEKSTRYVDFSKKINNHYLYFTPPEIQGFNLVSEYKETMDSIFETYQLLSQEYLNYLKKLFPEEKEIVLKTKVFDTLRNILPLATLSQVAFFGNGQSFEYLINRSLEHSLEEVKWASQRAHDELNKIIPAFLRRIEKEESRLYQKYLGKRNEKLNRVIEEFNFLNEDKTEKKSQMPVKLIEYDPEGENKIIAGLLYSGLRDSFEEVLAKVRKMTNEEKEKILAHFLKERKFRWYKVPRAFENVYLRFEILMNIGAWRDLQRHRMQTQYHQSFTVDNGYDVPAELYHINLDQNFIKAVQKAEELFKKLNRFNKEVAQYSVTFAHRVRFIQYQNLREFFWETELRTISQGHPDYRKIEQEKARIVQKIYPLIGKYLLVDFNDYDFARRGILEKIAQKEQELKKDFS